MGFLPYNLIIKIVYDVCDYRRLFFCANIRQKATFFVCYLSKQQYVSYVSHMQSCSIDEKVHEDRREFVGFWKSTIYHMVYASFFMYLLRNANRASQKDCFGGWYIAFLQHFLFCMVATFAGADIFCVVGIWLGKAKRESRVMDFLLGFCWIFDLE